jgi:hypothetical protein
VAARPYSSTGLPMVNDPAGIMTKDMPSELLITDFPADTDTGCNKRPVTIIACMSVPASSGTPWNLWRMTNTPWSDKHKIFILIQVG